MNKLMLFPLGFLLILIIYAQVYTTIEYTPGPTEDYTTIDGVMIDDINRSIEVNAAEPYSFNIWSIEGVLVIMTVAVAIGVASGIHVLGSGLSEFSQMTLMNVALYGGVWACLSAVASRFLFSQPILLLLWMVFGLMYVIGLGAHMTSGD